MIVIKVIGIILVTLIIVGAILHSTYFQKKLRNIKPYGKLVEVEGGKIHLHSMGKGKDTIVLLPGLGVGLPCADFGPLMRKLSENHATVCVEHLGVGFSSETSKPRTCENYVQEIREALKKEGFKPPYTLVAHSISSIYSEYYASKYPEEVEAIVSLDGTSTAYYEDMPGFVKKMFPIIKFQQSIGTTSIIASLTTNKNKLMKKGFTEKEINDMVVFGGFSINDTILEQMKNSTMFVKETMNLPYPKSVPYFKVISKQTYETPNKQLKITPQEYQHQHLERIGEHVQYRVLEGSHFIYLDNVEEIAKITEELLKTTN